MQVIVVNKYVTQNACERSLYAVVTITTRLFLHHVNFDLLRAIQNIPNDVAYCGRSNLVFATHLWRVDVAKAYGLPGFNSEAKQEIKRARVTVVTVNVLDVVLFS
jgi:hypothetical protein